MASSHPSRRAGRTATGALVVVSLAGTITASALAYADSHTSSGGTTGTTAGTESTDSTSSSSTDNGYSVGGIAPQLGTGSGKVHARSSGS
jgi:hypothetical protein